MNTLFDSAGLAIVAYLEVTGSNGTSTNCNSGVTTTKTGTGQYDIILPSNKLQSSPRDLIFVEVNGAITSTPYSSKVDNADPQTKHVGIYGGTAPLTTFADADFSVVIMRTIVPPPANSPA
jgi:hypothetical protein